MKNQNYRFFFFSVDVVPVFNDLGEMFDFLWIFSFASESPSNAFDDHNLR